MKQYKNLLLIATASLLTFSCSKDGSRDDSGTVTPTNVVVPNFIWKGLNSWYYWQKDVPNLADNAFSTTAKYNTFLQSKQPEELFYSLLNNYPNTDRFSWIVKDVDTLLQQFSGISKNSGMDFNLYLKDSGNVNVIGIVNYVIPNSPAANAGIKRGDVISGVNGAPLTVNNYQDLSKDQFSVMISEKVDSGANGMVTSGTQTSVSISAVTLEENPVAFAKTYTVDGKKIGYLVYNGFQSNYNDKLNAAFGQLKSDGATELILDLRYNGGGSVSSAVALGQMITGQFTAQPFVSLEFNSKHANYNETYKLSDKVPVYTFVNGQNQKTRDDAANSLNLSKIYVLTSSGTASASELTISGLRSYINVVTIGSETYGKFVGSITLFDDPSSDFTDYDKRNKTHKWAMQPITFAYYNAKHDAHPAKGIVPNILVQPADYFGKMKEFGDLGDVALKNAMEQIVGHSLGRMSATSATFNNNFVASKKTLTRFGTDVYLENFQK